MTDFTATQAGDAKDGGTYGNTSPGVEGIDYPDFTNGGDTLNDGGFALTNVSGILGDDTATPPITNSGNITQSGGLELRPGAEAIAQAVGTYNQAGYDLAVEPNDNNATLHSVSGSGLSVWNSGGGAIHHDGARNGGGVCEGLNKPEVYNPSYNVQLNWGGTKYYGFGDGTATTGLTWSGWNGDSFLWDGGKYTDCGQLRINLGPQGFLQQTTFRMDSLAIGAWRGAFAVSGISDHPIRLQNFITSPTITPRITNCTVFTDDPSNGYTIWPEYLAGPVDLSNTKLLNYHTSAARKDVNLDDTWHIVTTETNDLGIGIGRDATSVQSFNRVSVTGNAPNAHHISINGDGSGTTYQIDDLIIDGCGYAYPGDLGDMPLIYSQTVTLNNFLQIHSGGGVNPSLGADATININRGTFHRAVNIICGEDAGAGSNATMIGDIKNCIFSDPYGDAAFTDGGGFMTNQTADDVNYNAFIEAEMDVNNLAHGTLTGNGYFDNDMAGHLSDGANDMHVTDFQFADSTRNGYTWAQSLGYTADGEGLRDAILAGAGVTITGADQTVDTDANHANYRAYMIAGFTSSNSNLQGAGESGVDIGAFDILASGSPTYDQVIDALNPDHRWAFDGNEAVDQVGLVDGTTSGTVSSTAGCEDVTNCLQTNTIAGDRVSYATTTTLNNSAQSRKAVSGWFMVSAINAHPCRIYGEGTNALCYHVVMALGNNLMFEVVDASSIQLYGLSLVPGRWYHLYTEFQGTGYEDTVRLYVDGVLQDEASSGVATLAARGVAEIADPAGTVGVGGDVVLLQSPVNGHYNQWATWSDKTLPTATEIREELFEKGALPSVTISSDTEANMQTALDAYADTVRPDAPLCIRIEDVSGGGNLALTADNVTFDALASIHVQWMGSGTLNWTNANGADASIGSTPNDGTINFINPATLTINGLIPSGELRIYDDENTSDNNYNTELDGIETLAGTTFHYSHSGAVNSVIVQHIAAGYQEIIYPVDLDSNDLDITLYPVPDGNE
ncbi:MAG: hypothetical protein DBP02_15140 [gamma proteobacterium symbiont of Ctena orbiculata]|nr:MAG: hypothetical protein DBP02_15140 [gamma proteobacterium symbiont of Ctena orbiculata]